MEIFRYTDYYSTFKGKCPFCGKKVYLDPPDESTSDDVVTLRCPLCNKNFDAQLVWE